MEPARKDLQTLPPSLANARKADDANSSDQSPEDAVLSIDSGFQSNIHEKPGFKRNANWCVLKNFSCFYVYILSMSAAVSRHVHEALLQQL